jgi:hypothetical protein
MSADTSDRLFDPRKILAVSVKTQKKIPLTGTLVLQTADGTLECQINEDIAQMLSSDLDHFLSQS